MSRGVYLSEIVLPVARLGQDNPLPCFSKPRHVSPAMDAGEADIEMTRNLAYGRPLSMLPYTVQDGYTRDRLNTVLKTAVVENEFIRAEFLLGYGGRMWSLIDKRYGRELLHRNPILQPADLGLRNAWFAGGVEWNLGTTGHSPLTCSPVHAARVGKNVLRLWEFERMRELVYQLDIWAEDATLCVQVRVTNPFPKETAVYWWSNIAVPQTPGMRVLAPASHAWQVAADGKLRKTKTPQSLSFPHPVDLFYDIPESETPYIAALDGKGIGLLHTSTPTLKGRKLFHWGDGERGRRWQDWLSPNGMRYVEIQAGLTRTQFEHLPMPGEAQWTWLEVFRLADGETLNLAVPPIDLAVADRVPDQRLHTGSGWGALEGLRLPATPFDDDTLGREQQSWLSLARSGTMPAPAPRLAPASYQVAPQWRDRLENASPHNWFTLYHLGVARWHAGDHEGGRVAWKSSYESAPNPWAMRNLAFAESDIHQKVELLRGAHALVPTARSVAVEAIQALLDAGRPAAALSLIDRRIDSRIRSAECRAAVDAGQLTRASRLLNAGVAHDDRPTGDFGAPV